MLCKTTQNISSHEIYTHAFIMFHHIKLCVKPTITTLIHHCYHWVGSSAVLLFTAAVLLLMLAALGQSAPAQDQLDVEAMVEKVLSTKALSIQYSHGQSCQILSSSLVVTHNKWLNHSNASILTSSLCYMTVLCRAL